VTLLWSPSANCRDRYLICTTTMNDWFKISLLLSIFGFLKEIRPSEPFIYEFLVGPWRNITADDVTEQVFPVGTYSYLAQSIVVFLITDLCRYKPLIVLMGLSGITVWSMLLWTKGLLELQILEVRPLRRN
jgi:thiamine transporter 2/3